jgi:fructose/tagatose bisphosphate aldolase
MKGRAKTYYTYADLRWMPAEDVVDHLTRDVLAVALGTNHTVASEYKRNPFLLDDVMVKRLRDWLEAQK